MRSSLWFVVLFSLALSSGCTGAATGEGEVSASQSELEAFLKENPSPPEEVYTVD